MAVKTVPVTKASILEFVGKDGATHKQLLEYFGNQPAVVKMLDDLVNVDKTLIAQRVPDDRGRMTMVYIVPSPFDKKRLD